MPDEQTGAADRGSGSAAYRGARVCGSGNGGAREWGGSVSRARGRRSFTISFPASDPASSVIHSWRDAQGTVIDVSPLMRQALALGLTLGPTLERIASRLDALEVRGGPVLEHTEGDTALIASLLDFAHLE